jgi:hypothetical protein
MISIQCSQVIKGKIKLWWKPLPTTEIDNYIKAQITGKYLYLLFRVESSGEIWHEWVDIRKTQHTIWLHKSGAQEVKVFPVYANEAIKSKEALSIFNVDRLRTELGYYDNIKFLLDYNRIVLVRKVEFDTRQALRSLDNHIIYYQFSKISATTDFKPKIWIDSLIERVFKIQPKDQCQRRKLGVFSIILAGLVIIILTIGIPILYLLKAISISWAIFTGVKPSGINLRNYFDWRINNLSDFIDFSNRTNSFVTPFALTLYSMLFSIIGFGWHKSEFIWILQNLIVPLLAILLVFFILGEALELIKAFDRKSLENYMKGGKSKSLATRSQLIIESAKAQVCSPIDKD